MSDSSRERNDAVLVVWLALSFIWDVAVFGVIGYLVFWRHMSGWLFVLAFLLTYSPTLNEALKKRFGLKEEKP